METNTLNQMQKLPWKVKILYSSGDFAKTLLVIMTSAFSMFFYTDICGMDPKIVATIILIAKIWDFINDPMMGALVDRTRSKEGKCRIWLKYMSVPAGVVLALNFIMPELTATGKIVWVAVTYTLQGMASTALLIPLNTMMGRLTTDPAERATLNSVRGYYGIASNLVVGSATIPMVMFFGKGDMQKGFLWVAIIYGIIYALNHLLVFWGTRGYDGEAAESVKTTEASAPALSEKTSFGTSLKAMLTNKPWLFCFMMYFTVMLASGITGTTSLYYFQYNLNRMDLYSPVQMITLFASIPMYLFFPILVKKLGNAKVGVIGSVLGIIGNGLRYILADSSIVVLIGGNIIAAIGSILASSVIMLIIFDCGVYGEWKTGVANEAILVSGYSVSYKVGMALATPIAGYLLGAVPYVANAPTQEESVLSLFFTENTLLPALGYVVSVIFAVLLIKYEKMVPQMRAEIAERKEKAQA